MYPRRVMQSYYCNQESSGIMSGGKLQKSYVDRVSKNLSIIGAESHDVATIIIRVGIYIYVYTYTHMYIYI